MLKTRLKEWKNRRKTPEFSTAPVWKVWKVRAVQRFVDAGRKICYNILIRRCRPEPARRKQQKHIRPGGGFPAGMEERYGRLAGETGTKVLPVQHSQSAGHSGGRPGGGAGDPSAVPVRHRQLSDAGPRGHSAWPDLAADHLCVHSAGHGGQLDLADADTAANLFSVLCGQSAGKRLGPI